MLKRLNLLKEYYFILVSGLFLISDIVFILTKFKGYYFWLSLFDLVLIVVPLIVSYYKKIKFNELDINFLLLLAILISFFNSYYNLAIVLLFFIAVYPINERLLLSYLRNDFEESSNSGSDVYLDVIKKRKVIKTLPSEVRSGDKLVIAEKTVVPFDVVLLSDQATVSSLDPTTSTHHKLNIFKGAKVLAGSKTLSEKIEVKVVNVKGDTLIGKISKIKLTALSTQSKSSKKIINNLISYHLAVLSLAILLFAYNKNLSDLIKILVIASPYLLIISAKSIYMPIINSLYNAGILVKSSRSIELLAKTKTLVFSKNGVLTSSNKTVDSIVNFSDRTDNELLTIAASMSQTKNDAFSLAIIESAKRHKLKLIKIKHLESGEMYSFAKLKNDSIRIGLESIIKNQDINIPTDYKKTKLSSSAIYVVLNDRLSGILTFKEDIPQNNYGAIKFLQSKVKKLIIISSDNDSGVKSIAQRLNIKDYFSNQTNKDKIELISNQKPRPLTLVANYSTDKSIYSRANCVVETSNDVEGSLLHHADFIVKQDDLFPLQKSFKLSKQAQLAMRILVVLALLLNICLIYIAIKFNFNLILSSLMQLIEINIFVLIIIGFSLMVEKKTI